LTNEQIVEYKEAFSFFDKNNNGYFMISDLQEIMASLGMQITGNELLDIIEEIKTEKIDFKTFTSIMFARVFQEKEEIHTVFKMIDKVLNRFSHIIFNYLLL
jgi:Ca2+-binding EF-hand superfamily protein